MKQLRIKVCGMRDPENIRAIAALQPDYIGFIYYRNSHRYVGDKPAADLFSAVAQGISKTGVFVDETTEKIITICKRDGLDAVQLHGNESPAACMEIRKKGIELIKAFRVGNDFDFDVTKPYEDSCDYFLFDSKTETPGGSGRKFSWEKLSNYAGTRMFFLSGGIGRSDEKQISEIGSDKLYAVDINSRFETATAIKDIKMTDSFIKSLKGIL